MKKIYFAIMAIAMLVASCSKFDVETPSPVETPEVTSLTKATVELIDYTGKVFSSDDDLRLKVTPRETKGILYAKNFVFTSPSEGYFFYSEKTITTFVDGNVVSKENVSNQASDIYNFTYYIENGTIYFEGLTVDRIIALLDGIDTNKRCFREGYFGYYRDINGTHKDRPCLAAGFLDIDENGNVAPEFLVNGKETYAYSYCEPSLLIEFSE